MKLRITGKRTIRAMTLLLVVVTILIPGVIHAAVVEFPDPILEAAIRLAINKPTGDIEDTDLVGTGFETFNAHNQGISDLTNIHYFESLNELYLMGNEITDLSPSIARSPRSQTASRPSRNGA